MRKITTLALAAALAVPLAALAQMPAGHPAAGGMPAGHPAASYAPSARDDAPLTKSGKVLSTIDAAGYTYVEIEQNGKPQWIVGAPKKLNKGDMIRFDDGMVMTNFHSKSLNRDFPSITFVNRISTEAAKK